MAKQKGPAALNSRVIRISLGTYQLLKELAEKSNRTLAETLDLLITDQVSKETITVPRKQIPSPVIVATSRPAIVATVVKRAIGTASKPAALSINGDKHITIAVKPKGGNYE